MLRPEYFSVDQYQIRVVQASLISQLKPARVCVDHPTLTVQANHMGEGLVIQIFMKSRGFPPSSEIKKYHFKRKQEWRPTEKSKPEYTSVIA